jgi:hypothetical protein
MRTAGCPPIPLFSIFTGHQSLSPRAIPTSQTFGFSIDFSPNYNAIHTTTIIFPCIFIIIITTITALPYNL